MPLLPTADTLVDYLIPAAADRSPSSRPGWPATGPGDGAVVRMQQLAACVEARDVEGVAELLGRLAMFDTGGMLWTHRRELRELIGTFLDGDGLHADYGGRG